MIAATPLVRVVLIGVVRWFSLRDKGDSLSGGRRHLVWSILRSVSRSRDASLPSAPTWLAEVAAFAQVLSHTGILEAIQERVRFARARFGHYEPFRFCCGANRLCCIGLRREEHLGEALTEIQFPVEKLA